MNEFDGGRLSPKEYAAIKKDERDKVFALSDDTALAVANSSGRFRHYLDVQARFSRYSAVNVLLIMAQKPDATRIGDFDYWKERGGSVDGQTSFPILEPQEYVGADGERGVGYNLKRVFDISQVDTLRMKPEPAPPVYTERQILAALISKVPVKITGVAELPGDLGAMTDPDTGEISVRKGMGFSDTFRSVAQELGYLAADRNAERIPVNPFFVGYCTAYMLCKEHGVDTRGFDFTRAPDVFWQSSARGVKTELTVIRDAAESISGRMARHLKAVTAKAQETRGQRDVSR